MRSGAGAVPRALKSMQEPEDEEDEGLVGGGDGDGGFHLSFARRAVVLDGGQTALSTRGSG